MKNNNLEKIAQKINRKERLNAEDGINLLKTNNLLYLGKLATQVRQNLHNNKAYFIINAHLNYTNICALKCKLCAFGLQEQNPNAYVLSLDEIKEHLQKKISPSVTELHIVGGVHPKLPFDYYENMLKIAKNYRSDLHIQAFTAVEIDYLARINKLSISQILNKLRNAGLDSILGGGAEIFAQEIRQKIAGHKTDEKRWLEIHNSAHSLGIRSNASILYGHIEKPEHVIDHILKIRKLQDTTGGFNAFFAFAFHPQNTQLALEYKDIPQETSGIYDLKILATARLLLDNVPHIRAFWMMIGLKIAQIALHFGVDDLDGTVLEEQIVHAAGASQKQMLPPSAFLNMIKEAGYIPVQRNTLYEIKKIYN